MIFIANLLDAAMAKGQIASDYQLAKVIGISHQAISGYRMGLALPKDKVIAQLCALSGDDPHLIVAQIQAERASSPEAKNLWLSMAKRLAGGASTAILSVLIAIFFVAGFSTPVYAKNDTHRLSLQSKILYIVSITILSVPAFLMVRLRRFAPLFLLLSYG